MELSDQRWIRGVEFVFMDFTAGTVKNTSGDELNIQPGRSVSPYLIVYDLAYNLAQFADKRHNLSLHARLTISLVCVATLYA